ncbi:MAG: branched-chain amino acid ABC transporter permease [Ideonella sp.]|nr:branched-chain amino acid ABC transporter permease [Ideonella sp.]MCC7459525.1 branched-chain amino acid ABC transporter permease [Nitrospira sp.]
MHIEMKTSFDQDLRLFEHRGIVFWYALLGTAALAAPLALGPYAMSLAGFVCVYAIAGVGMMLLAGYAGQVSLGHAAFFAAGAYVEAIALTQGWPFAASFVAAGAIAALLGLVIGLPALRMSGIYLAVATLAFAFVVEEVLARWESMTRGNNGLTVPPLTIGPLALDAEWKLYYLALAVLVLALLGVRNLLRSKTGRALMALRDSEIAAQSMGVALARTKLVAFAASAALTGLAGALYAHKIQFLSPDQFTINTSVELLVLVLVGGLGSLHGAVFGAAFIVMLPQAIVLVKGALGLSAATQAGLDAGVYGLLLIGFMLYEPAGLYGRWVKVRMYLELFPFYPRATFRRQRAYARTDRLK